MDGYFGSPVEAGGGTVLDKGVAAGAAMVFAVGVLGGCSFSSGGGSVEPADTAVSAVTASSNSPSPSPSTAVSASRSPSPVPVTGPDQKLVTMAVTGGYAGVHQELILRGDGTVRTSDKGQPVVRRTSAAQFKELRTLLGDPALAEVPSFTMNMGAADMFQYTLHFNGRTVMTDRSSDDHPALDRLIEALSDLLPE